MVQMAADFMTDNKKVEEVARVGGGTERSYYRVYFPSRILKY